MQMTAERVEPMFRSVGQALSIAFSVAETPAAVKGTTDRALKDLAERRYGAAPVIASERTLNRDGLKDNEFRAQCVIVVGMVDNRLSGHERDTIIARFSKVAARRANAVRGLRDAYASLCNTQHQEAILGLVWAIYVRGVTPFQNETPTAFNARRKRRKEEWSLRSIEDEYHVSKSALGRDQQMLRDLLGEIERQAQARLELILVKAGLVGDPDNG